MTPSTQDSQIVSPSLMRFKLLLPTEILIEQPIKKLIAESPQGSFCLLPRHRDWTTAIAPGLLSFVAQEGQESFVAVDEGILVKCGDELLVSTKRATAGLDLGQLRETVEKQFLLLDAHEERARAVLMRLEALFIQRFAKT